MESRFLTILFMAFVLFSCNGEINVGGSSSAAVSYTQKDLKNVAIYYGFLNSLNSGSNGWNNTNVINDLNQYDVVVVGAGIENAGHGDYANSRHYSWA
jgi:hypothetical protein